MKKSLLLVAFCATAVVLCGCETAGFGEPPAPVWLTNNSDRGIVLQGVHDDKTKAVMARVASHTTVEVQNVATKYTCFGPWEIADSEGNRLRAIDKTCANDTIVYP